MLGEIAPSDELVEQPDLLGEVDRRMGVLHLGAGVGQLVGRGAQDGQLLVVDRHFRSLEPHADPVVA